MPKIEIPIVVVAYNRPTSISRLLSSLKKANYPKKNIELIISIDRATDNENVLAIANDFYWPHGKKTISYQKTNLGLRNHILKCGDLCLEFGSVLILEDDIYVSPNFYSFASAALQFSLDKDYIAGISLYNHLLNVHTRDNFTAIEDGYDNWYFQFASSWGQVWSKKQWSEFKDWYSLGNTLNDTTDIPKNVSSWSDKSWLKFFIAFLIEKDKYFLYPKISVSTNFSDIGTHIGKDSTVYQVPLGFYQNFGFNFSTLQNSNSVYDAFFENINLYRCIDIPHDSLCIDLYAYKSKPKERYWLTTRILNYKVVRIYGRSLRPIDANIIEDINGSDIYLYDTEAIEKTNLKIDSLRKFKYKTRHISYTSAGHVFINLTLLKFKDLFNKIIKQQ
ncbi:hypothetical protein MNBD_BACTEROID03-1075 [hydrothermal vent metagenome]|uniref:Glycosyltransferase 2-like domain-containing protein n=1 Tax=hydrothermal vent metagenome TaxID=652676 RepID=A0A3B0TSC7_9ZZZZ